MCAMRLPPYCLFKNVCAGLFQLRKVPQEKQLRWQYTLRLQPCNLPRRMKPLLINHIYPGDVRKVLKKLPDNSVDCIVTSPPYWGLRDYGVGGQLGLEPTPQEYIRTMVRIFRECKRILKPTGTLWLNIGDSYAGSGKGSNPDGSPHESKLRAKQGTNRGAVEGIALKTPARSIKLKPGDMVGIPWRLAFALQEDGWYLRQDIIWHKRNPMPESVTSRCTKAHEYIFLLSKRKSGEYYYDAEAIKDEPSEAFANHRRFQNGSNGANIKSGYEDALAQNPKAPHRLYTNGAAQRVNKRSVWTISPQPCPEAHFATFPEELPGLCIAASTSEKGNCAKCGAPWERIVEKRGGSIGNGSWTKNSRDLKHGMMAANTTEAKKLMRNNGYKVEIIGWQPTCECNCEEVAPPVVFDPFMGAGTTALVARKKLRHFAGIELNPQYIEIAKRRLKKELGLFL
jgi:DNA modification methylase